ncbi:MAG: DUF3791 domain-containing protein [Lachnospiraceae bacterium]|nr:DUF3791 domain-containing protein [Lachnospiraceae bacterium]
MNANANLLHKKYARVIELYANKYHVTIEKAMDRFYKSFLYHEISRGISDLHCMSDDYLTEELNEEWSQSKYYGIRFAGVTDHEVVIRFEANDMLELHIEHIATYDDFGVKTEMNDGDIFIVIPESGYSEVSLNIPNSQSYRSVQFVVRDVKHREQQSVDVWFDGTVNAHQMPYSP